jgi:hypothetical protein
MGTLARTDLIRTILPARVSQFAPQEEILFFSLSSKWFHYEALGAALEIGIPR